MGEARSKTQIIRRTLLVIISIIAAVFILLFFLKSCSTPTYTITFKDYDGSIIEVIEVKEGEMPSIDKIPSRSSDGTYDYIFDSWGNIVRANGDATYQAKYNNILINSKEDTDNKTINENIDNKDKNTGVLEEQYYYINFLDDDGTVIESRSFKYGSIPYCTKDIPNKTIDGYLYTFAGWNKTLSRVTGSTTYRATYNKTYVGGESSGGGGSSEPSVTKYNVTFAAEKGGSVVIQVPSGSKATKPDFNFGGYVIENWYEDASYTIPWDFSTGVITESKTLYGDWEGKYAVVFNHNGKGTNTVQAVMGGQSATQPTNPTYNGYEFMTWQYYTESHGSQVLADYDFGNTVDAPLILYAKWGVKIIFNPNGKGQACIPSEDVVEEGKLLSYSPVCDPLNSDSYAFGGWYKEAACNNAFSAEQQINGPGPITMYAGWNNVVKFELNGHGNTINDTAAKTGSKVTKPNDPSETGYVFKGWYTDNTTFQNPFDFNTAITAPMTLYAKWVEALTVKFYSTDLATVLNTTSVESGDKVTASEIPSVSISSGFAFKGWYKESTYVNKWDIDDPVTTDLNLYPKVVKFPEKFDTISIEGKDYRVLKEEGVGKYLVLGQYNASEEHVYETNYNDAAHKVNFGGITGIKYEGSELDTFLNTTWYGELSDTMKSAIQPVTITQNIYKCNSNMIPTSDNYIARGSNQNNTYCITGGYGSVSIANRKVYALDVDDLVNYLGKDNFTKNNIQAMVGLIANKYPWLRTASTKSTSTNAWYIDCGTGGPYHILNAASANIVRPAFVISLAGDIDYVLTETEKFTLTTSADETMGTINTETGIYPKNFEVRLVAKPNTGYRFVKWQVNDEDDTSADKNNATRLITITEDIKYTPVFEAAYTITTTVNDETMGSVSPATTGYASGESVTLTASANAGYRFVKWQIDGVDDTSADKNNATRTITVSGNATYTAVFEEFVLPNKGNIIKIDDKRYRVLSLDDNVALLLALYDASTTQAFDSEEPYNYQYKDSALDVYLDQTWYAGTDLSDSLKGAIVPTTITQHAYRENSYSLDEYTAKGYYTDDGGTVQKYCITKDETDIAIGERKVFALDLQDIADYLGKDNLIGPNIQNMFDMTGGVVWLRSADGGDDTRAWDVGTQKGRVAVNGVNNSVRARASFYVDLSKVHFDIDDSTVERFTITTSVNDANMGSVTGGDTYNKNMQVVLTAKPKAGYKFVKWDDDVTDNPRTVTVTEDAEYKAQFEVFTMPEKGNVINIGDKKYRVLKTDNTTALVVALYNAIDIPYFEDESNVYKDSTLDKKLNETWYNSLETDNPELKNAIVKATNLKQHTYDFIEEFPSDSNYSATGFSFINDGFYFNGEDQQRDIGDRFVFALGVQDLIDYLGKDNLTGENIITMFDLENELVWLRSAINRNNIYLLGIGNDEGSGFFGEGYVKSNATNSRPAFYVDLYKVDFEIDNDSLVDYFTITTSVNNPDMGSVNDGGTYIEGIKASLIAIAKPGYKFSKWQKNGVDDDSVDKNSYIRHVTVEDDVEYKAVFEELTMPNKGDVIELSNIYSTDTNQKYKFRVLDVDGSYVKLLSLFNVSDSIKYADYNTNIYSQSKLNSFLNIDWYGSLSTHTKGAIKSTPISQNKFNFVEGTPSDNNYFAKGTYNGTTNYYILEQDDTLSPQNRYVYAPDVKDVIDYIGKDNLSTINIQSVFEVTSGNIWLRSYSDEITYGRWVVDGGSGYLKYHDSDENALRSVFNIDLSKTIFNTDETYQKYNITVNTNEEDKGSTTGGGIYHKGAAVDIVATPKAGYKFVQWTDGDTDNQRTVVVTEDKIYTAVFEELTLPSQGEVIKIGDTDRYRVLTLNGTKALVIALFNAKVSQPYWDTTAQTTTFGTGTPEVLGVKYDGSSLDTYLNTTWYGEQSTELKGAIVKATNLTQGMYQRNNGTPSGNSYIAKGKNAYGGDYHISKGENYNPVSINDKFVFALDVQDVANYFNGDDISPDKLKAIFEIENDVFWLRSAITPGENNAFVINGEDGEYFHKEATNEKAARPAFYVDLSKLNFVLDDTVQRFHITVSANDNDKGTVAGEGDYNKGGAAAISATPKPGYRFVKWSDENTDNPRTVIVTDEHTYIAEFAEAVMPTKGDIVTFNNDADHKYRVLKMDGNKAFLLGLFNASDSIDYWSTNEVTDEFGKDGTKYAGSTLDEYLNTTWFGTLADNVKNAIQSTNITQNMYKHTDKPDYGGNFAGGITYKTQVYWTDEYDNATYVGSTTSQISRKVFALDVKDIYDYFDTSLITSFQLNKLFFDTESDEDTFVWLRSSDSDYPNYAWYVFGSQGYIMRDSVQDPCAARPAFYIDLFASDMNFDIESSSPTPQHTITVQTSNPTYGTVSGGGTFDQNSAVILTATPACGYRFVKWEEDDSVANPRVEIITEDKLFTAIFEEVTMPTEDQIIKIDNKRYRVLDMNNSTAFVFALEPIYNNKPFNSVSNTNAYKDSDLDNLIENGWYANLDSDGSLKKGIIETDIDQYTVNSLREITYTSNVGPRHAFALDYLDVINYLGDSDDIANKIRKMFNAESGYIWLRSAYVDPNDTLAWSVDINNGYLIDSTVGSGNSVYQAFYIDLCKPGVSFEIEIPE